MPTNDCFDRFSLPYSIGSTERHVIQLTLWKNKINRFIWFCIAISWKETTTKNYQQYLPIRSWGLCRKVVENVSRKNLSMQSQRRSRVCQALRCQHLDLFGKWKYRHCSQLYLKDNHAEMVTEGTNSGCPFSENQLQHNSPSCNFWYKSSTWARLPGTR